MSSAIIGIIGTLAGAIIGFITSEIAERNRWKRSLGVRWDETRRALYATYLVSANQNLGNIEWAARNRELATPDKPFELPEDFHRLGDADNAAQGESIQLICGKNLATAAHQLLLSLWAAKTHVLNGGVRSDVEMQDLIDKFVICRDNFIEAARAELGIGLD
jgi:hypothetical protein